MIPVFIHMVHSGKKLISQAEALEKGSNARVVEL